MGFASSKSSVLVALGVILAFTPAPSHAELTRVEITTRADVLNGKAFGDVGPYEKLHGKAYFAVDPKNPRNQVIADIDLAPRNREGKVEFSADLFILKPKDPSRGNGVVFFDVVNRGQIPPAQHVQRRCGRGRPDNGSTLWRRLVCSFRASRSSRSGGSSTSRMS